MKPKPLTLQDDEPMNAAAEFFGLQGKS